VADSLALQLQQRDVVEDDAMSLCLGFGCLLASSRLACPLRVVVVVPYNAVMPLDGAIA
jgi:hypothetical protein